MTNTTFSSMFTQILNASGMNLRQASSHLSAAGVGIPYSTLSAYKSFTAVPTYDRAFSILQSFNYEISSDDLMNILSYSKDQLSTLKDDSRQYFNKGIRINPETISDSISAEELSRIIDQRILDLGESNFNTYITSLIKEDLSSSGILSSEAL